MWGAVMAWLQHVAASAPEIFIFLAIAIGTLLGRIRFHGFTLGATACTLVVAAVLGQFGAIVIPPLLKSIFFGLFVFTIGYRSGPEFFASLSLHTLAQVVLALVMGASGLTVILIFAHALHLDPGTAAGLGAGSLTQSSMMGTASGALEQLGLSADRLKQEQANIAAGYAVTYVCGYILVLLFVPLVAPRLMGIDLKDEAAKLEAALSGGAPAKQGNLLYRKFQARAYRVAESNTSPWGCCALCHRQRRFNRAWTDHCRAYICWVRLRLRCATWVATLNACFEAFLCEQKDECYLQKSKYVTGCRKSARLRNFP
jgi:putative transport protein